MSWDIALLRDITVNLDNRRRPLNGAERNKISEKKLYPYIGANNIMDYVGKYLFDEEILCVAEDGGSWGLNETCASYISEKCWVNNHAHVLGFNGKVDLKYLMYYLNNEDLNKYITGSTRGKLTKSALDSIEIPLPPLPIQKRIAEILDAADTLKRKDQELLKKYDELAQAVFIDMFGDPVKNEKGWEVKTIGDSIDFMTSGSRGWAHFYTNTGDIFLRINNVGYNELKLHDLIYVTAPKNAESIRTVVRSGDILLSITADLGRTCVIPDDFPKAFINQHLAIIRLKKGFEPTFVSQVLSSEYGKLQFMKLNKGGVKAGLNFDDIKSLVFINPPIEIQIRYKKIVAEVTKQIIGINLISNKSDNLFNSLIQKAFNGELVN